MLKKCFVPTCDNNSQNCPTKVFIRLPQSNERVHWFKAISQDVSSTTLFCCEDHFILAEDAINYQYYKTMGTILKIKKGVVPHLHMMTSNVSKDVSQISESSKMLKLENITLMEKDMSTMVTIIIKDNPQTLAVNALIKGTMCFVPSCLNNSGSCPTKIFTRVPKTDVRVHWFKAVGLKPVSTSSLFCCEDHFDINEDWYYNDTGAKIALKKDAIPSLNLFIDTIEQEPREELSQFSDWSETQTLYAAEESENRVIFEPRNVLPVKMEFVEINAECTANVDVYKADEQCSYDGLNNGMTDPLLVHIKEEIKLEDKCQDVSIAETHDIIKIEPLLEHIKEEIDPEEECEQNTMMENSSQSISKPNCIATSGTIKHGKDQKIQIENNIWDGTLYVVDGEICNDNAYIITSL